uniref:Uncharacterized protein n=1 Tax=Anguilla anguilla TaxID=7936 RepID=A0A0E9SA37_ANGAN
MLECWNIAARDLFPFSQESISEVGTDRAIGPGSQLGSQLIPVVLDGVEVRALCRPVKFFHTDLDKTISMLTSQHDRGALSS